MTDLKRLFWGFVTIWGSLPLVLLLGAPSFYVGKNLPAAYFLALVASTALTYAVKSLWFRPRPDNETGLRPPSPVNGPAEWPRLADPRVAWRFFKCVDASSFPSVHSARVFQIAVLYGAALEGVIWTALFLGLAGLIGWSRVVRRRHHPTDVLAGAFVGVVLGLAANALREYM